MELTIIQEDHNKAMMDRSADETICRRCPVAQALMRMGYTDVVVGLIGAKSNEQRWCLPEPTYTFIALWPKVVPKFPITLELTEE
jgi:hypothetical protein